MERIILKMRRVEMLSSEFIASILSDNSLEIIHGEKIRIIPARCLESYRKCCIWNLIVSLI